MVITNGKNHVMIDAGIGYRPMTAKLAEIGLSLSDMDAVLVTHEHSDHIRSLPEVSVLVPVFSHADTLDAAGRCIQIPYERTKEIDESGFSLGSFDILPFRINHDAAHPLGFVVRDEKDSVCYMTDTGYISKGMMEVAKGCKKIVLESNHDKDMLQRGCYPQVLKKRILSDRGHLCNAETALCAMDFVSAGAEQILLAHLSENNNLSELAYWTTRSYLDRCGVERNAVTIRVATQKETVHLL